MNQEYVREINLVELFFRVLEKWRKVLAAAVVLAVLLGGLKAVSGFRTLNDPELLADNIQKAEAKQKQYEDAKAYGELQIANLEKEIQNQIAYQESSLLMQIDPYNEYQELITYYVETDYQIMPGMTYQNIDRTGGIINAYVKFLDSSSIYEQAAKTMGLNVDPGVLRELVDIEREESDENGIFTVAVKGSEQSIAAGLLGALEQELQKKGAEIRTSIGEHKLTEVNHLNGYVVDIDLANKQAQTRDNLTKMQDAVVKKQKELLDLKDPKMEGMTQASVMKDSVKFAILGVCFGMFLSAVWLSVGYVTGSVLPGERDLKNLYGISILGRCRRSGNSGIDRKISAWEGYRASEMDETRAFELIAANLRNRIGEHGSALLAGGVSSEVLQKAYEKLLAAGDLDGSMLISGGNLVEDPGAIRELNEVQSVVFLEDRDQSRHADFAKAVATVRQQGKEIIGLIELS